MIVGSGIDVVEIARIERALDRRGDRFARRIYTEREIASCAARRRAGPHFAVRFAAKEALMKALGTGWAQGVSWLDIETRPAGAGLALELHGPTAALARGRGGARTHLAVHRSRTYAVALVLLEAAGR